MDLSDFAPPLDNIVVTLKRGNTVLKNDDETDMTWTFYAPLSPEAKRIAHEFTDKRVKEAQANDGEFRKLTSAEMEQIGIENIVKTTAEWNITWQGTKPEFTVELGKEIMNRVPFIRASVEKAFEANVNFTPV